MAKKVFYNDDARRRVLGGARILYKAVKTTMGPKGRNVVIGGYVDPTVTHDGVTVAKSVDVPHVDDDTLGYKVGADLIKKAASKLNDVAGDGTTTVTVLTYHLLNEANKLITAGISPMALRRELESAAEVVLKNLQDMAEPVEPGSDRIAQIGTISAGDHEIGKLIADVIAKIGREGMVSVETGNGLKTESEIAEGYSFDRGFMSPYFVTDSGRMEAVYEKPAVVLTNKNINTLDDLLPLMEKLVQSGHKSLLLIAGDVSTEVLGTLILNKLKGVFNAVAVKAPGVGDRQLAVLEDMAALTGAKVIVDDADVAMADLDIDVVGTVRKIIVGKDKTTIIKGDSDAAVLEDRIKLITSQIPNAANDYEKSALEKRRADLAGKVAIIRVGGATETEIDELKYRVDDAVAAVRAALAEGIVPGGGVTLLNLSTGLNTGHDGAKLLVNALERPFRILMSNAGINADEWLPQIRKAEQGMGIDIVNPAELIDLKEHGVVDPVRVTREAIQNAVSIAGTAMTMGALVVDIPQEQTNGQGGFPL